MQIYVLQKIVKYKLLDHVPRLSDSQKEPDGNQDKSKEGKSLIEDGMEEHSQGDDN